MYYHDHPIFDCFIDRDGVEYLCEVYDACDGAVVEFSVFPLLSDGSKGDSIIEDGFEDEVQERYTLSLFDDCY